MKTEPIVKNARITSTKLTIEDHGCLCAWLTLDMGGMGCCYGGFNMWSKKCDSDYGARKIVELFKVIGVESWEQIPGKHIRYVYNGLGSTIKKIGHIIEDKWFTWEDAE